MIKNTKTFAIDTLPDFISGEHPQFKLFLEAYYEYLEKDNTEQSTSVLDLFKSLSNPAALISNAETNRDIDETLDGFVDFFAREIIPVSANISTAKNRFAVKKIKDVYLSKGSPKSFKLLFRLLFDEEITIRETGGDLLRPSNGKYLDYVFSHFLVIEQENQLPNIDFDLAVLSDDSDNFVQTVMSALTISKSDDKPILRVQLADTASIDKNREYFISDASNSQSRIKIKPILSLSDVSITNPSSLYSANDKIQISSSKLNKSFDLNISNTGSGTVDFLAIRDRGSFYRSGDTIGFAGGDGSGGFAEISKTIGGKIYEIDEIEPRTGDNNRGYLSSTFTRALVPIGNGGSWRSLPRASVSFASGQTFGAPYNFEQGVGAEVSAVSKTIGSIKGIEINEVGFFLDSDDVNVEVPAKIVLENIKDLSVGDPVVFQRFEPRSDTSAFQQDSESITFNIFIAKEVTHDELTGNFNFRVRIPYDFDPATGLWLDSEYLVSNDSESWLELFQELNTISSFDASGLVSISINENSIDGGEDFNDPQSGSSIDGGSGFGDPLVDAPIDGGPNRFGDSEFAFGGTADIIATISFEGANVSNLTETQFDALQYYVISDSEVTTSYSTQRTDNVFGFVENVGSWESTGIYAKIIGLNKNTNVATLSSYSDYSLPSDSEFNALFDNNNSLITATKISNGTYDSDFYLPVPNAVVFYSRGEVQIKLEEVSRIQNTFFNEDGFLSSTVGATLQDNLFFSDHTYNVQTRFSMRQWREKVKTLLHPAGKIMVGELNLGQTITQTINKETTVSFDKETSYFTFDSAQEHYHSFEAGESITADNTFYKSNPFEAMNLGDSDNTISADNASTSVFISDQAQHGNAWWDFEPVGLVSETTTQDSDGTGKIKNEVRRFERFNGTAQDFYKTNRGTNYASILKTQFNEVIQEQYTVRDSESSFATFSDSDVVFESINYDRNYRQTTVDRKKEITIENNKDFNNAMREDGTLTFTDSTGTFTNFDAYEMKWNKINSRFEHNTEGWMVDGYTSAIQNVSNNPRNETINVQYSTTKTPLSNEVWKSALNWAWANSYNGQINITQAVDLQSQPTADNRDPKELMRGRRG